MVTRRVRLLRVGVSLLVYLAACLAFVKLQGSSLFLSVLAIFVVALLAIRLHSVLHRELRSGFVNSRVRWLAIGLVPAVGAVFLAVWLFGGHRSGVGFVGLALLYLGMGVALQELRSWEDYPRRIFLGVLAGCVAVTAAALVAAALGVKGALWLALLGFAATPVGLTLTSEMALRALRPAGLTRWVALGGLGLLVLLADLFLIHWRGVSAGYLAVFGAALVLLMLGIGASSNVDIVFVIAAAAVVWTLAQRSVPVPSSLMPRPSDDVVVALGDSFISGEGAEQFYEGTNSPGTSTCRRAPTAYPVLLLQEQDVDVPHHLVFLACSGAKAIQVVRAQLAQLAEKAGGVEHVRLVLLSIGGNDALFGSLGRACLLPVDCTALEPAFTDNLVAVERTLDRVYAEVRRALPGARVLAVPYPVPIAPRRCGYSAFSAREHGFLYRFAEELDDAVARAAVRAGFEVVDTMRDALGDQRLRLCDAKAGDAGVNFFAANSVFGTLEQSANPLNWVHNSLHPNARGHEAMRAALVAWLKSHPDLHPTDAPATAAPVRASTSRAGGPCRDRTGGDLDRCATSWTAQQTGRFLLRRGWLALPAVGGAWLLALQLILLWRAVFDDPQSARSGRGLRPEW